MRDGKGGGSPFDKGLPWDDLKCDIIICHVGVIQAWGRSLSCSFK
jgi:hypothetical protein